MTTFFITSCAHGHQNLFQATEVADLMVATLLRYRDAAEFELHEYVVMPDHIHLLLSVDGEKTVSRAMQLVKGGFSHALREQGIVMRAVWQPRYHDRRVRDDQEFAEFANYIRQNPVRRGFVQRAEDYKYSSAKKPADLSGLKPLFQKKEFVNAGLKASSTERIAEG
jgi:putative transposase